MLDGSGCKRYSSAMRVNGLPKPIKLICLLMLPLFFSGCTLPGDSASRDVKLSDAMRASANNDRRDLGGDSSRDNSPDVDVRVAGDAAGADFIGASYDKKDYAWQVPVDVSYALPINSSFAGITHFTLTPLSIEDEENFVGVYVGGALVDFKSGSLPARAVDQTWMLETGLTVRHYLNSSRTAFSPYLAASAGYALLYWDYRNPVIAGGDTISSDCLSAVEGSIVFGISTRRDKWVTLFGEAGIGGTVFWNTTNQGFDNDVFHSFGFLSVKAGLSVKF